MRHLFAFALFLALAGAQLPNCHAPGEPVPGALTQCNPAVDCDWCSRNHLSFDFLCCEAGAWNGPHFINPLLFFLAWNNVVCTLLFVLAWEVVEAFIQTVFGSFPVLFSGANDSETLSASILGDGLIQGMLALTAGYALRVIFVVPTLMSTSERANAYNATGRRALYIVVYFLVLATYLLPSLVASSGLRYGLIVQLALLLLYVWAVLPFAFNSYTDRRLLWARLDGSVFEGRERGIFLALVGVGIILAYVTHIPGDQPLYSINEWYQQWWLIIPYTLLLWLVALAVSTSRRDYFTVAALFGLVFALGWLAAWFGYHIGGSTSTALVVVGSIAAALSLVAFSLAAFVNWPAAAVPSGDGGDALGVTQRGSRSLHSEEKRTLLADTAEQQYAVPPTRELRKRRPIEASKAAAASASLTYDLR